MTGIEKQCFDNVAPPSEPEVKLDKGQRESVPVAISPTSRVSMQSSAISQGTVNATKEYLVNVFTNATKLTNPYTPPPEVTAKALKIDNSHIAEFVKEVSEESIKNPDLSDDAKLYLSNIYSKLENGVDICTISNESFEPSEGQLEIVENYMLQLYSKVEGEIAGEIRSTKSISLADSRMSESKKAYSSKLNPELINKSDVVSQSRASSVYPESTSDYQAPNIMIIEDKTQFLVSKHIQGIRQEGFEHAFSPIVSVKNNLAEKARKMSAKGQKKPLEDSNKEAEKSAANPQPKVSEEEYIQRLLMQFEEEGNKKQEKPNPTTETMKRLLKQATLIKNEIYSSDAEPKKKISDINKPSSIVKDKVEEESKEISNEESNSNKSSNSNSRKSSPERKLDDDPTPEKEIKEVKKEPVKKETKIEPISKETKIEPIKKEDIKANTTKIPQKMDINIKKTQNNKEEK